MGRIAITATSALVLLLAAVASPSAARPRPKVAAKCPLRHSRPLAADALAQVYKGPNAIGDLEIFGCAYGRGRQVHLGRIVECGGGGGGGICLGVERETLAGPIVVYEEFYLAEGEERRVLIVRDLRDGRALRTLPTGTPAPSEPSAVGGGPAVAIVLKGDGAVAWIEETSFKPAGYTIHAVDKSGSRLLASGADVDRSSLALAGSRLYWTQGGKPASGVLH